MTEAGHDIQHPAVIRARQGRRPITVQEWSIFAYVLSLPPHKLLESEEPLSIGAADGTPLQHDNKAIRDWLAGTRPLEGVDRAIFYSTVTAAGPAKRHSGSTECSFVVANTGPQRSVAWVGSRG